jgi:outer membrane lipase/esterase
MRSLAVFNVSPDRACKQGFFSLMLFWAGVTSLASSTEPAYAGLDSLQGQYANAVEEASATANQATYESLLVANGGPCREGQSASSENGCSGYTFDVFQSTRELVQTANELTGIGPTEYSLGLDLNDLGQALRWTAGEEFSGQGSLNSDFVNSQLSGLASRMTALRLGASGFSVSGTGYPATGDALAYNTQADSSYRAYGGGASADTGDTFSRWGGFLNGSYGWGDKEATGNEDAFDLDGYEIKLGVDYRVNDNWVVGVVGGYSNGEIDFKQVENIVVDGGITVDGLSLLPFFMFQKDMYYASLSVGYQSVSFDSERYIKYPSLNPDVESTNTITKSNTDSDTYSAYGSLGYTYSINAFQLEPHLDLNYMDITIDAFTERDINKDGFDLEVADQDFNSLEGVMGISMRYMFQPSFALISAYVDLELHNEFENDARRIDAFYRNGVSTSSVTRFSILTDELDDQYYVFSVGASAVLRGGRQAEVGGPIGGGVQAFIAYQTVEDLDFYSLQSISAGVRYEF